MSTSTSCYHLANGNPKTVIVTGGANGIGAKTARTYYGYGCNIVVADLPSSSEAAIALITSLPEPSRALYCPTNIVGWGDMQDLFRTTKKKFGQIDIVVANAGLMESKGFFDFEEDEHGELKEATEAGRIIDVNLKGTMNSELVVSTNSPELSLTLDSSSDGYALHEIEPTGLGRCTRIYRSHRLNVWVLRWYWRSLIRIFQAWRIGLSTSLTIRCPTARRPSQRRCALLHPDPHDFRLLGEVERT
jgi:hypothetical protein